MGADGGVYVLDEPTIAIEGCPISLRSLRRLAR
jgi:hypothetical protein